MIERTDKRLCITRTFEVVIGNINLNVVQRKIQNIREMDIKRLVPSELSVLDAMLAQLIMDLAMIVTDLGFEQAVLDARLQKAINVYKAKYLIDPAKGDAIEQLRKTKLPAKDTLASAFESFPDVEELAADKCILSKVWNTLEELQKYLKMAVDLSKTRSMNLAVDAKYFSDTEE